MDGEVDTLLDNPTNSGRLPVRHKLYQGHNGKIVRYGQETRQHCYWTGQYETIDHCYPLNEYCLKAETSRNTSDVTESLKQ